jgi:hypothetical protein
VRVVILLLAGAALGFALGRLTAPEGRGRGGGRGAAQEVRDAPPDEPHSSAPTPAPEADGPPAGTVLPSRACEDHQIEAILVDFAGFEGERKAWIGWTNLRGAYEDRSEEAEEDGVARFVLVYPDLYDVWWLDREGRKLGARVAVEPGKITTLRAADHRTEAPPPAGLGTLRLHLETAEGEGLATSVSVVRPPVPGLKFYDDSDAVELLTDALGNVSVALRPGRYEIRAGAHRSEAVVKEGATTFHRLSHEREGDLLILADRAMFVSVKSTLDPFSPTSHAHATHFAWAGDVGKGEPVLVPYAEPGDYFIHIRESFGVPLDRVTVRAGQTTQIRCKAPGGMLLSVKGKTAVRLEGDVKVCRVVDGNLDEGNRSVVWHREIPDPYEVLLMPGRYIVTVSAEGHQPASVEFEVSDKLVEVKLDLVLER